MTLREFGQSVVSYYETYITEVTTRNVLDWTIGHILLTAFLGLFGLVIGGAIVGGAIEVFTPKVAAAWEKTGLPTSVERLDMRFGPFYAGLIICAGALAFFIALGVIIAFVETAQS